MRLERHDRVHGAEDRELVQGLGVDDCRAARQRSTGASVFNAPRIVPSDFVSLRIVMRDVSIMSFCPGCCLAPFVGFVATVSLAILASLCGVGMVSRAGYSQYPARRFPVYFTGFRFGAVKTAATSGCASVNIWSRII